MRTDIRYTGTTQPNQRTLAGIDLDRQRDKAEQCRRCKQNDTEQQQLRELMDQQHTAQQHPRHDIRSEADHRYQCRPHLQRSIRSGMLYRMTAFMGCNGYCHDR